MKEYMHKNENMPLQSSLILCPRAPWQMIQCACFPSKILCVVIFALETTWVPKISVGASWLTNSDPRAAQNLLIPHPRGCKAGKCLVKAWEGGGGGGLGAAEIVWLMHKFVVTVLLTWNAASSDNKADKNAHSYWLKRRYWSLIPVNSLIMTTVTCFKWIWQQSSFRTPVTDSSPKICIFSATACNYVVLLPIQ